MTSTNTGSPRTRACGSSRRRRPGPFHRALEALPVLVPATR
ncbi:hypothetical protein ACVW19_005375 [Streptomyces sp. TE5632]